MAEYAREEINAVGGYYAFGKELCNGNSVFDFDTTKLSVHTLDIGLSLIHICFLGKNKNTLPQPPNTKSTLHFVTTCDRMTVSKVS